MLTSLVAPETPALYYRIVATLQDPEASSNDRFVALELLKNACVAWNRTWGSASEDFQGALDIEGENTREDLSRQLDATCMSRLFCQSNKHSPDGSCKLDRHEHSTYTTIISHHKANNG